MGTAFDMLQQVNISSMDEPTKDGVRRHIEAARACVRQFFVKLDHFKSIDLHINELKGRSAYSELKRFIPCLNESITSAPNMAEKCDALVELSSYLGALHAICGEFRKQIRVDQELETPDLVQLTDSLKVLETILPKSTLLDPKRWVIPFLQPNEREIAVLCLALIDEVFAVFENKINYQILRPTPHYNEVLHRNYPLPKDHFTKGN